MNIPRFHLAFPVHDLEKAKTFYTSTLGCPLGRESDNWIDFNLYGHQVVAHLSPKDCMNTKTNPVDGDSIPARHFGVILPWADWEELCKILISRNIEFLIKPRIRFKNVSGEQGTFFIQDPSGNALEFKSFKNDKDVFKK
tara:strand:+ start:898 stop:1317 length:420 start_codon:yes stop_codon:yes gene_type:complete